MSARFHDLSLSLAGAVAPMAKGAGHTRPMGGWLTTLGHLGADGKVTPTQDREGQIMEAVQTGSADWTPYVKGGTWNDTHGPLKVGLPSSLAYYGPDHAMAKAHGKVGFYTTGRLFDRTSPDSWRGLCDPKGNPRAPTDAEFDAADEFWRLAKSLEGSPRSIALSAEGSMRLSPCRKRILACTITDAAVCRTPMNPDATLEIMSKAVTLTAAADNNPCARCACPKGACAITFGSPMPDPSEAEPLNKGKPGDSSVAAPPPTAKPKEDDEEDDTDDPSSASEEDEGDEDTSDEDSAAGEGGYPDMRKLAEDTGKRMAKGEAVDAAQFMLEFGKAVDRTVQKRMAKALKVALAPVVSKLETLEANNVALHKALETQNEALTKALAAPQPHDRRANINSVLAEVSRPPAAANAPRFASNTLSYALAKGVISQEQINRYRANGAFDDDPNINNTITKKVEAL